MRGPSLPLLLTAMSARECPAFSESVVILGLNAALQKRFVLPPSTDLVPGNVHRSVDVETGVGGKGQDVGVAMSILMDDGSSAEERRRENDRRVLLAQFLGGSSGDYVGDILAGRHGLSDELTVRNSAPLRTCTTIVGSASATELVEASGEISPSEMDVLRAKIDGLAEAGEGMRRLRHGFDAPRLSREHIRRPDVAPGGRGHDRARRQRRRPRSPPGVARFHILRLVRGQVGRGRAQAQRGRALQARRTLEGRVRSRDIKGAVGRDFGVLAVPTGGEEGIRTTEVPVPDLSERGTLYPIGAGDTVAAGTLAAWQYLRHNRHNGGGEEESEEPFFGVVSSRVGERLASSRRREKTLDIATSFAFGLACGSASCLDRENSVFDVDDALGYFDGDERGGRSAWEGSMEPQTRCIWGVPDCKSRKIAQTSAEQWEALQWKMRNLIGVCQAASWLRFRLNIKALQCKMSWPSVFMVFSAAYGYRKGGW
ncbi:hypothetical protein THAOC_36316, partial [Thalassiosira oceanica]